MNDSAIEILLKMEEVVRVKTVRTLSLDSDGNLELRWMWKVLSKWPEEFMLIVKPSEMLEINDIIRHAGDVINESIRNKSVEGS